MTAGGCESLTEYVEEARHTNERLRDEPSVGEVLARPDGLSSLRERTVDVAPGDVGCDGPDRKLSIGVPVEVFDCEDPKAVYLSLHGGGWMFGSPAWDYPESARLARECGVSVVSVDYRLAPEHPYPAAVDDCVCAATWLVERSMQEFGVDRLLIGGYSAGASLAVLTLLRLRDDGFPVERFAGANLRYGAYDFGMTPSQRRCSDALIIDQLYLKLSRQMIFPGMSLEARRSASVSPLYADLTSMPPALMTVGALDPFVDDSLFLGARWRLAGAPARVDVYPESPHAFDRLPTQMAAAAQRANDGFIRSSAAGER